MNTRASGVFLLLMSLLVLPGCDSKTGSVAVSATGEPAMSVLEGTVYYRERMMLPPGAEVEVQLQDISRADAMATVMASAQFKATGGPPYPFSISYDKNRIDPRMRYGLRATISVGEQLLFTTTEYIDPFAGNPLEVLVRRVAEPVRHAGPVLEDTVWELRTLDGETAVAGAGDRKPDIQFLADEMRAGGFSGCNRFSGGYSREGGSSHGSPLKFGPLAGTMMACAEGGELEQAYLQALGRVDAFRLQGDTLSLLSGPDVLATFEPR